MTGNKCRNADGTRGALVLHHGQEQALGVLQDPPYVVRLLILNYLYYKTPISILNIYFIRMVVGTNWVGDKQHVGILI